MCVCVCGSPPGGMVQRLCSFLLLAKVYRTPRRILPAVTVGVLMARFEDALWLNQWQYSTLVDPPGLPRVMLDGDRLPATGCARRGYGGAWLHMVGYGDMVVWWYGGMVVWWYGGVTQSCSGSLGSFPK